MHVIDLKNGDEFLLNQAAALLVTGFAQHWPNAWPTMTDAQEEVRACLDEERICRAMVDQDGRLLGWIGAIPNYDGHAWELHPLVVDPALQRQGIGRALVADLEQQLAKRKVSTLYLGSDDEDEMTSLSGQDLYTDIPGALAGIVNFKGHPYEFYQKVGFTIVGVIPDANGPGRPDIWLAKRVGHAPD